MNVRQWSRDLAMGVRFAFTGGREGWVRLLLTGVGVGLGVALLLLTTAIPNALAARDDRADARWDLTEAWSDEKIPEARDDTLLIAGVPTTYHDTDVRGRELEPEGPKAPLPPGVAEFPAVGEMLVSPALEELLASDEGALLRERLPDRIVGTIGESGLIGPSELAFYRGGEGLSSHLDLGVVARVDGFGNPSTTSEPWDPVLLLLVLVVFVVLLMPVGVFIATAVRFGGERRDRRLAALRLIGSDSGMTRRIAAGEAFAGALLGLVLGAGFFLLGRQAAGSLEIYDISVYPGYLNPSPALAALVAVAVPAAAVLVTLFALRGVVIEPLGVVRTARPARRRLWWRLLLPVGGLALLVPMIGQGSENGEFNQYMVTGGVVLLLVGITALLPWVVETVVARLGSGAVSWQLAVRRLQVSSGSAARMVNGIAVAVAGAIALQMLFAGVEDEFTQMSRNDLTRAQMSVEVPSGVALGTVTGKFEATKGVDAVYAFGETYVGDTPGQDAERITEVTVGGCRALREVASLPSCRDGDVFAVSGGEWDEFTPELAKAGQKLWFDPDYGVEADSVAWTVPGDFKKGRSVEDPTGMKRGGFLITPGALPEEIDRLLGQKVYLGIDRSVPDAYEYVRNTAAAIDPYSDPLVWTSTERSGRFDSIRTGLLVGAACVLFLIGASLLVSQLEQLRERKKLLSALVAFGTRRRTLSLSVLWQTALPIVLGLALAVVVGLTLGTVLLKMTNVPLAVDWTGVLTMTGFGAAVVLAVTLLSLPPLLRLMRPEGLRTE
ncbi:ABC transporter permease [Streptomyces poonensis]|uniref:Membrane protein n=1 Tax=Streptomyces poonensis TaxID=68255 RepID=A0A918P8K5_9ACTN|nr:ABC transporter permease [Streptomyces poonensis]GGY90609.1 membrane protein [Streptomyces poonensis]GLJ87937.1 membrane protein [Streptomyces poonensis]